MPPFEIRCCGDTPPGIIAAVRVNRVNTVVVFHGDVENTSMQRLFSGPTALLKALAKIAAPSSDVDIADDAVGPIYDAVKSQLRHLDSIWHGKLAFGTIIRGEHGDSFAYGVGSRKEARQRAVYLGLVITIMAKPFDSRNCDNDRASDPCSSIYQVVRYLKHCLYISK